MSCATYAAAHPAFAGPASASADNTDEAPKDSAIAPGVGHNEIYLEGLGQGFLYSINYVRRFGDIGVRVGFSEFSFHDTHPASSNTTAYTSGPIYAIPLGVTNIALHSGAHSLELGAGATVMHLGSGNNFLGYSTPPTSSKWIVLPSLLVGYHLAPRAQGFLLRVGLSPLVSFNDDTPILPWPYLAVGVVFG